MESEHRRIYRHGRPFPLTLGEALPDFQLAYETWGELNEARDNAILLFPGLSASAHAKSHDPQDAPGWWEAMIGPGLALDTNRFFVVCFNHLGGCFGSTGPSSPNPNTGKPYGPEFPRLLIQDLAEAAHHAATNHGVAKVHSTVGASMGGMVAMEYAARFADHTRRMIMISASGRPGPMSIAFRYVQRQVILNDPSFHGGWYYETGERPSRSMAVSRQIGNITYRSREEFERRFGRSRTGRGYRFTPDFQVESYLHHMGHKLADNFDANSFLYLSKSMDLYSLGYGFPTYEDGVRRIQAPALIIGVSTDMLFPIEEQFDVYDILTQEGRDARFERLESNSGHDAFLVEVEYFTEKIKGFLET